MFYSANYYQEKIETYMKSLAQTLSFRSRQVAAQMDAIITEDTRLIAKVKEEEESHSAYLGNILATIDKQKIRIRNEYSSEAAAFGQQLQQTNPKVAAAYNESLRLERYATAA